MNNSNTDASRQGTRQSDRGFPRTDTTFSVETRSLSDWLVYLQQFAGAIQFVERLDAPPTQTWQGAFPPADQIDALVQTLDAGGDFSTDLQAWTTRPDFSLLLSFLQLLVYVRAQFAQLTQSHQDYYLTNVLRMQPRPVQPDTAHLVLTLAESAPSLTLDAGVAFAAGSDASDNALTYQLKSTRTFNQALLQQAFSVSKSVGTVSTQTKLVKTQLLDVDQGLAWPDSGGLSFGESEITDASRQALLSTGLIVASRLLWLSAGTRTLHITFDADFEASLTSQGIAFDQLPQYFDVYVSTPTGEILVNDQVSSLTTPFWSMPMIHYWRNGSGFTTSRPWISA